MSPVEAKYEQQFVEHCRSVGVQCLKLRVDGRDGFPDRTLLFPGGEVAFVEFKRPGCKLRPQQKAWKAGLEKLDFRFTTAFSLEDAINFLDDILENADD